MKFKILFIILVLLLFKLVQPVSAQELNCEDRYLTIVNPVRSRELWRDDSLSPLTNQYQEINKYGYKVTWLLQYDVLEDNDLINEINKFDETREFGVFLEISPDLTKSARVIYPHGVEWYDPNAVFLSGYSQSERRKLIDTLFEKFKSEFGYHPKSVGAWWIDSYSLNYLKNKYDIKAALIVADQKTTDNYGVWGQWWGVPYFPTKANILVPSSSQDNFLDVVMIQWAQRDLGKAYGEGKEYSNYSLQANDYTERGENTLFFVNLVNNYLSCDLPLGQITIGLETGMESVTAFPEHKKQLEELSRIKNLKSVTMSEFADRFKNKYKNNPEEIFLKDEISAWKLTPNFRENEFLSDHIVYNHNYAFSDYFISDKNEFLNRKLPLEINNSTKNSFPWFILVFIAFIPIFVRLKMFKYYIPTAMFVFSSYLLVLMSYSKFGWDVYFGPILSNIEIAQMILVAGLFVVVLMILKFIKLKCINSLELFVLLLPLSYFLDGILAKLRYTSIEDVHYLGFSIDSLRFFGINYPEKSVVYRDFDPVIAGSLLKLPIDNLWNTDYLYVIANPIIHILIALVLWLLTKKLPSRIALITIYIMLILFLYSLKYFLNIDPRVVLPT